MDVLSSTASAFAVVSLAIQLAESVKELYDFWSSIKGAPENIHGMATDLELLSSLLSHIASEAQSCTPDDTVIAVLKNCSVKLKSITVQVDKLEPGFASKSSPVRKWSAIKTALKSGKLEKLLSTVEGIKTTLILAQQNFLGRLNRHYHESHQQAITSIHQTIDSISSKHISTTSITASNEQLIMNDHLADMRIEISQIGNTISNPVYRFGFQRAVEKAMQYTTGEAIDFRPGQEFSATSWTMPSSDSQSESISRSIASPRCVSLDRCKIERHSHSILETTFGTIYFEVKTTSKMTEISDCSSSFPQTPQYKNSRSFVFYPAPWLIKLGLSYSLHVGIGESSVKGWSHTLAVNRPVPDDSLIFDFARQGNLPAIRTLMSKDLASVRDIDSYGRTALWFAARGRHAKLCEFLIGAGADKNASMHKGVEGWNIDYERTPLLAVANGPRQNLQNSTDMLRLFADCIDFTDENSDVWPLIIALSPIVTGGEPSLLVWLLRSFSSSIKPSFHHHEFALMLDYWMRSEEYETSELLTSIGGCHINALCCPDGYSILHYSLARFTDPLLYLKKGANPHLIGFEHEYSPHWESPTSLAMLNPVMFDTWWMALMLLKVDFEEFVRLEILQRQSPLLKTGWNSETLLALFYYQGRTPLREDFYPARRALKYEKCNDCSGNRGFIWIEPKWLQKLERIKRRQDSDNEPVQSRILDQVLQAAGNDMEETMFNPSKIGIAPEDFGTEGYDDDSFYSSDEAALYDETIPSRVDILELYFEDDTILCMPCWENYRNLGYNSDSRLLTKPRKKSVKGNNGIFSDEDPTVDRPSNDHNSSDDNEIDEEYSPFLIHA